MRQQGQIKDWKDDKGFGYVAPLSGGAEQAFVHINSFLNRQRRPVNGDLVSYEAVQDFQKRWQAQAIRYVDEQPSETPAETVGAWSPASGSGSWSALPLLRALLVLLVLGILGLVGYHFRAKLGWVDPESSTQTAHSTPRSRAPKPASGSFGRERLTGRPGEPARQSRRH